MDWLQVTIALGIGVAVVWVTGIPICWVVLNIRNPVLDKDARDEGFVSATIVFDIVELVFTVFSLGWPILLSGYLNEKRKQRKVSRNFRHV